MGRGVGTRISGTDPPNQRVHPTRAGSWGLCSWCGVAWLTRDIGSLDQNLRALFFFAPDLDLRDFNFRRSCIVRWYESSVAAAIDNVLLAEVVLVEQSSAEARNADKKSSWMAFFNRALCQWPKPRMAFHEGTGCLRVKESEGSLL